MCGITDLLSTDRLSRKEFRCAVSPADSEAQLTGKRHRVPMGKLPQQCGFYCRKGKVKMKKLIMLVVSITLLALVLTACGKSSEPKETTAESTEAATETNAAGAEDEGEKLEDGTFKVDVTMEGGTGKASIQSPTTVVVKSGKATAVIIWSSENYDYMIVDGKKYEPITTEGGSTFKIPVLVFDEPFAVIADTTAMSEPHEIEYTLTFDSSGLKESTANVEDEFAADKVAAEKAAETKAEKKDDTKEETKADDKAGAEDDKEDAKDDKTDDKKDAASDSLEDGTYIVKFDTDSTMFHVNEAKDGKGELTVKDGDMTVHISLVSKKIVNLFPGKAEDAQKDGAALLDPTTDTVTYSDGMSEDVYGFDVPVPALGEEFDLAILGESGNWFDHKVSVSDPQPVE